MARIGMMTEMLDTAVAKLAALSPDEQDRITHWILDELPDEALWDKQFSGTQDALAKLASEARNELRSGKARIFDPTRCEVAGDPAFLDRLQRTASRNP